MLRASGESFYNSELLLLFGTYIQSGYLYCSDNDCIWLGPRSSCCFHPGDVCRQFIVSVPATGNHGACYINRKIAPGMHMPARYWEHIFTCCCKRCKYISTTLSIHWLSQHLSVAIATGPSPPTLEGVGQLRQRHERGSACSNFCLAQAIFVDQLAQSPSTPSNPGRKNNVERYRCGSSR